MSAVAYAAWQDVQDRMTRTLSEAEQQVCEMLLQDAAVMIDTIAPNAGAEAKRVVSCRMVMRAIGDGGESAVPLGATQGSMSGLGYSQSWTISNGSSGELYLGKAERQLLGVGDRIGGRSPLEGMTEATV